MNPISMRCTKPLERVSIASINSARSCPAFTAENIMSINMGKQRAASERAPAQTAEHTVLAPTIAKRPVPVFKHPVSKGQKLSLTGVFGPSAVCACFGWNVSTADCDVDVSAFLLNRSGKVIGDSWFVFYGQEKSPDQSVCFVGNPETDREMITVDFTKLNHTVEKIVFVMTINDAFAKKLHFGMIKDAYIRITDSVSHSELAGFALTDYYTNVISMVIGEIYQYNGIWKFNAVGNGLARDLAGLCEFYGVQVI